MQRSRRAPPIVELVQNLNSFLRCKCRGKTWAGKIVLSTALPWIPASWKRSSTATGRIELTPSVSTHRAPWTIKCIHTRTYAQTHVIYNNSPLISTKYHIYYEVLTISPAWSCQERKNRQSFRSTIISTIILSPPPKNRIYTIPHIMWGHYMRAT